MKIKYEEEEERWDDDDKDIIISVISVVKVA